MIQALESEQGNVGFPHQRRLAPEPDQFRRAAPDDLRDHHAVDASGGRRGRHVQIGVAVHINQADVAMIAPRAGDRRQHGNAIAAQNERKRAGFHGNFDARAQIIEGFQNRGNVSGAGMLVIRLEHVCGRVAEIGNFESGGLQPIRKSGGAQRCGRALVAGAQSRRAAWPSPAGQFSSADG